MWNSGNYIIKNCEPKLRVYTIKLSNKLVRNKTHENTCLIIACHIFSGCLRYKQNTEVLYYSRDIFRFLPDIFIYSLYMENLYAGFICYLTV